MIDESLKELYPHIDSKYDGKYRITLIHLDSAIIISHSVGQYLIYGTENFCDSLGLTGEEKLVWKLKFGRQLPSAIDDHGNIMFPTSKFGLL